MLGFEPSSPIDGRRVLLLPHHSSPHPRLIRQSHEHISSYKFYFLWVTFLAETSKDLEIILIIIVLSLTNRFSRTIA